MISAIYVKSYLHPDRRRDMKRKTEEVHMERAEETKAYKSGSTILKPSTFKFSKPLEYEKVTSEIVKERNILFELCVKQKYSQKSFVIATLTLTAKSAVRTLVKTKLALLACISTRIPENMKVYNASELGVISSRAYSSNPNLQRNPSAGSYDSQDSWAIPYTERRASSDSDLHHVTVDGAMAKTPSIEITVPEVEDEELEEALQQIAVMEEKERSKVRQGSRAEKRRPSSVAITGLDTLTEQSQESGSLSGTNTVNVTQVEIHMPKQQAGADVDSSSDQAAVSTSSVNRTQSQNPARIKNTKLKRKVKKGDATTSAARDREESEPRPDTPTWDYYEEPLEVALEPADFEYFDMNMADPRAPQLPMATSLDMPEVHNSSRSRMPHDPPKGYVSPDLPAAESGQATSLPDYCPHGRRNSATPGQLTGSYRETLQSEMPNMSAPKKSSVKGRHQGKYDLKKK